MTTDAWLRNAQDEIQRKAHGQHLAEQRSAENQLNQVVALLQSPQMRKWRQRLKGKGLDIDSLSPAALLVAIMREVDEAVNHE